MKNLLTLFCLLCLGQTVAQDVVGGELFTREAYLYGRFETRMQSVGESGVVSSFFLFNLDLDCNWPAENNEIDIEMTGNSEDVLFTSHYPGPNYHTDTYDAGFNPHAGMHDYAFEWEPGIVRWFVDGELVNVQDQPFVDELIHPMRIFMNLWVSEIVAWVGPWDPGVLPQESTYDYVRFYQYTPGSGSSGTDNNFTFAWEDSFDNLDLNRWEVSEYKMLGSSLNTFLSTNVVVENGELSLQLTEATPAGAASSVTFQVDMREYSLAPGDVVYLNGTFNDWCGTCAPMENQDGIWVRTENLLPDAYEYLFTINGWSEIGNAPAGSDCDWFPCDEFANYGLAVPLDGSALTVEATCWASCEPCATTSVYEPSSTPPQLLWMSDLLGRRVRNPQPNQVYLFYYDDGRVVRSVLFE